MSSIGWDWQPCKVAPFLPHPQAAPVPARNLGQDEHLTVLSKRPWRRPLSVSHSLCCCTQCTSSAWIKTPMKQLPLRETGSPTHRPDCRGHGQASQPATPGTRPAHRHSRGQASQSAVLGPSPPTSATTVVMAGHCSQPGWGPAPSASAPEAVTT